MADDGRLDELGDVASQDGVAPQGHTVRTSSGAQEAGASPQDGVSRIRELMRPDPRMVERIERADPIWQGRIFRVETLDVSLADGSHGYREIVRHHGGAAVCAVRGGRMCLVRQYRVAVGRMSLEVPAGKLEAGEDPAECAARELAEETGLVADHLEFVARARGSIGFTDESTSIYLAHGLTAGPARPDEGEFVDTVWVPVRDVVEAASAGVIQDAKTVISALAALERGLA